MVGGPHLMFVQSGESNGMVLAVGVEEHMSSVVVPFFLIPTSHVHITATMEPMGGDNVDDVVILRVRLGGTRQTPDGTILAEKEMGRADNDGTLTATIANPGGTQLVKLCLEAVIGGIPHYPDNQGFYVRPA